MDPEGQSTKPENNKLLGDLEQVVAVIPDELRPLVVGFFRRVAADVVAQNTNVVVEGNNPRATINRVSPDTTQSYQDMFDDVLARGALNVHRFRQQRPVRRP